MVEFFFGGGLPKSLRNFFAGKHWADFGHLAEKFCQIVFEELAVENLHSRHRRYLRSCMWFSYCVGKKNKKTKTIFLAIPNHIID